MQKCFDGNFCNSPFAIIFFAYVRLPWADWKTKYQNHEYKQHKISLSQWTQCRCRKNKVNTILNEIAAICFLNQWIENVVILESLFIFYRKGTYKFSWIREDMKINVFQLNSQVGQFYSSVQGMQK